MLSPLGSHEHIQSHLSILGLIEILTIIIIIYQQSQQQRRKRMSVTFGIYYLYVFLRLCWFLWFLAGDSLTSVLTCEC